MNSKFVCPQLTHVINFVHIQMWSWQCFLEIKHNTAFLLMSVLYKSLANSAVLRWSCFVIEPNGVHLLVALYTARLLVVRSQFFHTG